MTKTQYKKMSVVDLEKYLITPRARALKEKDIILINEVIKEITEENEIRLQKICSRDIMKFSSAYMRAFKKPTKHVEAGYRVYYDVDCLTAMEISWTMLKSFEENKETKSQISKINNLYKVKYGTENKQL